MQNHIPADTMLKAYIIGTLVVLSLVVVVYVLLQRRGIRMNPVAHGHHHHQQQQQQQQQEEEEEEYMAARRRRSGAPSPSSSRFPSRGPSPSWDSLSAPPSPDPSR
ncbi:hypothetical protein QBC45DRAFT_434524 [Copromyces sp. CBS 386.78]|nr:hypothetical protein QBC45DRAFT_434524 [Copromyces sp. CBS 386.78]